MTWETYSKTARPFKWKYSDVKKRIKPWLTNFARQATSRLRKNDFPKPKLAPGVPRANVESMICGC
jgi:hypothetical protein